MHITGFEAVQKKHSLVLSGLTQIMVNYTTMQAVTYMELNMPIRAVKVKPIANMDFILTYMQAGNKVCSDISIISSYKYDIDTPKYTVK